MLVLLIAIVALYAGAGVYAQLPDKAIVIEDHTGAWCGWCVLGNQALEDLHAEYGDRIIPIAWHNDDGMALAMQKTMATKFKISGYPTGLLNRDEYTINGVKQTGIHPDNWVEVVKEAVKLKADVGVKVTWTINEQTKVLSGTVTAEIFKDMNEQLAFNVAIMEDSVTGSGSNWDQNNYLTNRKGYESNPYYYKPSLVKDFYHINVLREFIGGATGEIGTFPAVVQKGDTYTYNFELDLKKYPLQNIGNIWVAGLVLQHGGSNRILNAASYGKKPTPKSTYWKAEITVDKDYVSAKRGDSVEYTVSIENKNDKDITAILNFAPDESNIPEGWKATYAQSEVMVPSKQTVKVPLVVQLGNNAGFAALKIQSQVKPFENYRSLPVLQNAGVLSDGVQWAIAKFDLANYEDLKPFFDSYSKIETYNKDYALIPINSRTLSVYDFKQFSLFILPESYKSRTSFIFDTKLATVVRDMSLSGIPIIITSPMNLWFTADNYGSIVSQNVKKILNEDFGITGEQRTWGPWLWNSSEGKSAVVGVRSIADNGITQTMDFNVNETDSAYTVQTAWLDEVKILDENRVHKILEYYGDKIGANSTTAAVWVQMPRSTMIYQGFGFEAIKDEPIRRTLLANYLGFLRKTVSVQPENINTAAIKIYPNPAAEYAQVQCTITKPGATAELVDALGNSLQCYTLSLSGGEQSFRTNISALAAGKYYVIINDAGVYSVCPFIIER